MPLTLLDYGKPNPFGRTVGKPRRLAWPVNVYRVTLPRLLEDHEQLNPFERVTLKLIDAGGAREAHAIAQETCLPKDLVQCVLLRLHDKGFLDEHNQIITERRDKWNTEAYDSQEFVTAYVFRELATGKMLPHLHFLKDNPLKRKEEEERFRGIPRDEASSNRPPTPRDVIAALRAMQKRMKAFNNETRLPLVQLITIVPEAELYHLDCPIAIQTSDGEFRIADPFGSGCSLVLESAFWCLLERDERLERWLMTWKDKLSNREPSNQTPAHREPYDNDANWGLYPKLLHTLRMGRDRQHRSIDQIHAAMEWALFYSCAQRQYASAVDQLKLTNQSEHPASLQKAAKEISLDLPPGGLFPVTDGKLDDFLDGKAELGTVLSLSLLMAADDLSHPLRRIAAMHHDLVVRLLKIKKDRDELGHGSGRARTQDVELPDEAFMREVVAMLLPSVHFSDTPAAQVERDAVSDSLLDARTSIQGEFGFALFNRLGTNLQNRLITAERYWLSCNDGDDARVLAFDLYATLQSAFRRCLAGVVPPDVVDSEYIARAKESAKACALGDLPVCLLTVKRTAIRETLQGNDQSLQSCVVALLLVSDTDTLRAIAQSQPSFLDDVALVIDRRGHGNEPLPMPKDRIRALRQAAYTTIKTLMET